MVARLARFYGGGPDGYWRMKTNRLWSLYRHMPVLQAEHELSVAGSVAYGSGSMKKADAAEYKRGRERVTHKRRAQTLSREQRHAAIERAGIPIRRVP